MWTRRTPILLAALALAACGESSNPAPPAAAPSASPAAPPSTSASAVPSAPPTASPTPPPAPKATAADGTRLAACADGTCEVAVSRPARIKLRTGTLEITKVTANDVVAIDLSLRNGGGGTGTLRGTCGTISYFSASGGRGEFCADASAAPKRPRPERGEVALQLAGWTADGAAVLRVVTP
jgi:hypothetical protein